MGNAGVAKTLSTEEKAVKAAFGAENRQRILDEYFAGVADLSVDTAWNHVYRLLLWINPTISLAHCYESDKCQPHKAWYPRSLAFHAWVAAELGVPAADLRDDIDYLFRAALPALAEVQVEVGVRRAAAKTHLEAYEHEAMPPPGDDPVLVDLIAQALGIDAATLDEKLSQEIVERVYTHFARENKRKNLLGRGFEDTLAAIIARLPGNERWTVGTRVLIEDIPGFTKVRGKRKKTEVDLALWEAGPNGRRILVSSKWSVRADRERQFASDFNDYTKANEGGVFEYSLITNEFDAARLDAACSLVETNQHLLTDVVHVNPAGVLVAYGTEVQQPPDANGTGRNKARELPGHLGSGRLTSLSVWLTRLLR